MSEIKKKRTLSKKEIEEWDSLYFYIKDILGYDKNQNLPRDMVLRIKGLAEGKFMANKNQKTKANYSYKIILLTFKFCRYEIINAFNNKNFQNEQHKFFYMMKIIENNINEVYNRYQQVKLSDEKLKKLDIAIYHNDGAEYIRKTEEIKNKELKKYW